jgi:hypothetical protein
MRFFLVKLYTSSSRFIIVTPMVPELCALKFLVPYRQIRKGLLVYLRSVCPSVCHSTFSFPDFSLQWMKIFNWNLIYDYISMSYRPSLSFVTLDQFLTELFSLMFTFSFPDFFFLPRMKSQIWNFLYGFLLYSYTYQVRVSVHFTFFWLNCGPLQIVTFNCLTHNLKTIRSRVIKFGILMHLNKKKCLAINQGHSDIYLR